MGADGSHVRYLTNNGVDYLNGPHDRNPAFSPDGEFIVFERDAPDFSSSAIYVMKVDGSAVKSLGIFARRRNDLLNAHGRRQLTRIEDGGAIPRWGVMPD
jgi:Tol biopolymer transport system component